MLKVLKGFEAEYLKENISTALIESDFESKVKIIDLENAAKNIAMGISSRINELQANDLWITYEEFSIAYELIFNFAKMFGFKIVVIDNNKYFNAYPLYKEVDKQKIIELIEDQNESKGGKVDNKIYSYVYNINNQYYIQYYNYEIDYPKNVSIEKRYKLDDYNINRSDDVEFKFDISEDIEKTVENISYTNNVNSIGISMSIDTPTTREIRNNIIAYCKSVGKNVYDYENIEDKHTRVNEYKKIAVDHLNILGFEFRTLQFYKNPMMGNEVENISQEIIIDDIVSQIDTAKRNDLTSKDVIQTDFYRDIFVTAPTGAGKSIMFQIPAIYAAQKYGSISVVISPLVELMNDQVENLEKKGYYRAARLNSDINVVEKQEILEKINNGEIDIIYISPEALLSYSIESIIGTRDVSIIVIDEAHIVTTWGQGFRPDYWYLGSYIDRLRKRTYKKGQVDYNAKKYYFPICTFTATSVFGGEDDGVNETSKSLYLIDPIKYIGTVKRDDISFDIKVNTKSMSQNETEENKVKDLNNILKSFVDKKEKSLVYFPYNSLAKKAYNQEANFIGISNLKNNLAIYTGQVNKQIKQSDLIEYKDNKKLIMLATKAFGMGIDIDDIKHVYHYAISGNLNDYLQEIGRAARHKELKGIAHMHYYDKDMMYTKRLFGMSAIRQYHIYGVIRILSNIYQGKRTRNLLITPQIFESVFPGKLSKGDLEVSVKTALLNIEKDLLREYKFPVIVTKPRSMFTKTFAVISDDIIDDFSKTRFWQYFKKISERRENDIEDGKTLVSDTGDIYTLDLKKIWEEQFSKQSFQKFKHSFYNERESIFNEYAKYIYPRCKLEISLNNDKETFKGIKDRLISEIDKVSRILGIFQNRAGIFTIKDFEGELVKEYKDKILARTIANSYFKCIESDDASASDNRFYSYKRQNEIEKYTITNSNYRVLAESIVNKCAFIKSLNNYNENNIVRYKNAKGTEIKKILKVLNLLTLFNIANYEFSGGENPEIFIRINEPARIKGIANGTIKYKNKIVEKAQEKHNRDCEILSKFIKELNTDEERWNYIENYFLGKNVLGIEE